MINQIITETNVVIRNFLNICGLLGAPGSSPSIAIFLFELLMFIGSDKKKISHQIRRKIIIEPVMPNFKLLQARLMFHCNFLDEERQQAFHGRQFLACQFL